MIGYYVHHVGQGHLRQALAITAASSDRFTMLSSLARPAGYEGEWLQLPRDDDDPSPTDPTAFGQLHWAPIGDAGLRDRMALIADWVRRVRPAAMVVDVSVEITAFTRLMGVPVITMVLPGLRADPAHRLGYALADVLIAPWPASVDAQIADGTQPWAGKIRHVGAFSRFDGRDHDAPIDRVTRSTRRVLALQGMGGSDLDGDDFEQARTATAGWDWTVLGGPGQAWQDDPWPMLVDADVVVTHAGLNALAEIAAARRPAIVLPQRRPHSEQTVTTGVLAREGLAITLDAWPAPTQWPSLLDAALRKGGAGWSRWSPGDGAAQVAAIIAATASVNRDRE
jgi:hypothetical protein